MRSWYVYKSYEASLWRWGLAMVVLRKLYRQSYCSDNPMTSACKPITLPPSWVDTKKAHPDPSPHRETVRCAFSIPYSCSFRQDYPGKVCKQQCSLHRTIANWTINYSFICTLSIAFLFISKFFRKDGRENCHKANCIFLRVYYTPFLLSSLSEARWYRSCWGKGSQ